MRAAHVRHRRRRSQRTAATAWRRHLTIMLDGLRASAVSSSPASLWAMTPDVTDPELEAVAWDLDPLLDGAASDPAPPSTRCSPRRSAAPTRSPSARRQGRRARRPRPRRGDARARRDLQDLAGRAGSYARLRFSTDTADPASGALLQRVQEKGDGDRDHAAVLRARVGRARRRARRGAARHRGPGLRRHHLRDRAPLPPAPADRARGEDPRREGADRPHAPGRGCSRSRRRAITVELDDGAEPVSLEVALARLFSPTATCAATPPSA